VLVEALAAGASVVAVDTPVTRDVLAGAGALVPGDAAALAAALRGAFAASLSRVDEGLAVARGFDATRFGDRTLALYAALLGAPEPVPPGRVGVRV
jgi:glycosyltransferase involved in cell wall biosynthesis